MIKTEIESLKPYILKSRIIGMGLSAVCFKTRDNKVIKIFMDTANTRDLFNRYPDMLSHIEELSLLKDDTFVSPEEVLIKEGKVVGYICPYIDAKVLKHLNRKENLNNLLKNYEKLKENVEKLSEKGYLIRDLHPKNILFDGDNFYIIDLDRYYKEEAYNTYSKNMYSVNDTIIRSVFNVDSEYIMNFLNQDLQEIYLASLYNDHEKIIELFSKLEEIHNIKNKNQSLIKKNKVLSIKYNTYYKFC